MKKIKITRKAKSAISYERKSEAAPALPPSTAKTTNAIMVDFLDADSGQVEFSREFYGKIPVPPDRYGSLIPVITGIAEIDATDVIRASAEAVMGEGYE